MVTREKKSSNLEGSIEHLQINSLKWLERGQEMTSNVHPLS